MNKPLEKTYYKTEMTIKMFTESLTPFYNKIIFYWNIQFLYTFPTFYHEFRKI